MSLETVRAAIVERLAAVPGIGRVHEYERFAASETAFRTLYSYTGADHKPRLLGWHVRRAANAERRDDYVHDEVITWRIRGFMALEDESASEIAFDALIEAVRAAFRADHNLAGACASTDYNDLAGLQLDESGPVMFAGVLCHGVTLTLYTRVLI